MISDQLIAWTLYLVSALGLVVIAWHITRNLHRIAKRTIRVLTVALLFTPFPIADGGDWLAPAYLVAGYEAARGNLDLASSALVALFGFMLFLVLLVFLESVFRRFFDLDKA